MTPSAQQISKYDVIAVKSSMYGLVSDAQALNSKVQVLRFHSPFAYQGFRDQDPCLSGSGMPFGATGPATEGCAVYAGHWLYAPGTRLRSAITVSATSIAVDDASRFTAGRWVVIYDGQPGAFTNAEHARVAAVNKSTNTLTLDNRGHKSTPRSHPIDAIVAEHVIGNGDNGESDRWVYNQSTACPQDSNGRQFNQAMAEWLAETYQKNPNGSASRATVAGVQLDSDFHIIQDSGGSKRPDVNNDLVQDDGFSATGENLWGEGMETLYERLRELLPNAILVGGVTEARGYTALNGTELEGWPQTVPSHSANRDYKEIDGHLTDYSVQMHHGRLGPRYTMGYNKMPTKLYPSADAPNVPDNTGFRFGFGLTLLDDGYYGQQNWHVVDPWWDEYAVDVVAGSPTFGRAIASNARMESPGLYLHCAAHGQLPDRVQCGPRKHRRLGRLRVLVRRQRRRLPARLRQCGGDRQCHPFYTNDVSRRHFPAHPGHRTGPGQRWVCGDGGDLAVLRRRHSGPTLGGV